jgi:hypothetical protein
MFLSVQCKTVIALSTLSINHFTSCFECVCVCVWNVVSWREEHKLQSFKSKFFRKIFGRKKDEVREQFKILHNEEFKYNPADKRNLEVFYILIRNSSKMF